MDDDGRRERIGRLIRTSGMSVAETWIQYFALGGSLSELEIGCYLQGSMGLPVLEGELLEDALREAAGEFGADSEGPLVLSTAAMRPLGAAGGMLLDPDAAEQERCRSLGQLRLLDTPPEQRFDAITHRAARRFGCELATLALIADDRQFIKSAVGDAIQGLERARALCDATIRSAGPLILEDTMGDERFRGHPVVANAPYVRFYAGFPLRGPGGWLIGTLCVMSRMPRRFTQQDRDDLQALAQEMQHEVYPGWKAWSAL